MITSYHIQENRTHRIKECHKPLENRYRIFLYYYLCHCCSSLQQAGLLSPRLRSETVESSRPPRQDSFRWIFLSRVCIVPFVIFSLWGGGCLLFCFAVFSFYFQEESFCFLDNPTQGRRRDANNVFGQKTWLQFLNVTCSRRKKFCMPETWIKNSVILQQNWISEMQVLRFL